MQNLCKLSLIPKTNFKAKNTCYKTITKNYCTSKTGPESWNSPRELLFKAQRVSDMIDTMFENLDDWGKFPIPEDGHGPSITTLYKRNQEDFSYTNQNELFKWSLNAARLYCIDVKKGINANPANLKEHTDTIDNIIKHMIIDDPYYWAARKATHFYDVNFLILLTNNGETALLDIDDKILGYYYWSAIKRLQNMSVEEFKSFCVKFVVPEVICRLESISDDFKKE